MRIPTGAGARQGARKLTIALIGALALAVPAAVSATTIPLPSDASTNSPDALTAPSDASVTAVSCPSAGACSAVGRYVAGSGDSEMLLLDQADGAWHATEGDAAALSGSANGFNAAGVVYPNSISCASAGECSAVGFYNDAAGGRQVMTVDEHNGVWGPPAEAPVPAGTASAAFADTPSISCVAPGECVAVGYFRHSNTINDYQPLVLTEHQRVWSAQTVALPADAAAGPDAYLDSVSCTSTSNCVAVGDYLLSGGGEAGVFITESGGSWRASRITPTDVTPALVVPETMEVGAALHNSAGGGAVTCPTAGNCVSVGDYTDGHGYRHGLLLTQHGSSWSDQAIDESQLHPAVRTLGGNAAPQTVLSSVACTSAGNCTALGNYLDTTNDPQGMIVSEVNGAWQPAQTTALPADAYTADASVWPSQVACSAAGNCVGGFQYEAAGASVVAEEALLTLWTGSWTTTELSLAGTLHPNTTFDWNDAACAPSGYCASLVSYSIGTGNSMTIISSQAPDAPTVTASSGEPGSGQAGIAWSAPASSGLAVSGYTVVANDQSIPANGGQTLRLAGDTLSATLSGLTPGDAYTFTVTASSKMGVGLGGSSGVVTVAPAQSSPGASTADGGPAATPRPNLTRQIRASLARIIAPSGPRGRLRAIAKTGGYAFSYRAVEAGRLTIGWYQTVGNGRHRHRVLVAAGAIRVRKAGAATIRVRLSRAGRRLIAIGRRPRWTAALAFTPTGGEPVKKTGGFRLR